MGLIPMDPVTRSMPSRGYFVAAAYTPATARPTMSASLWALATKLMRNSGLATAIQRARAPLIPCRRASLGT